MAGFDKFIVFFLLVIVIGAEAFFKGWKQRHRCEPLTCHPPCRKVTGDDGCHKCECEPVCSPPKCEPGCEVEKEFDGPCPGCVCKGKEGDEVPVERICEPVKCEPPCKEIPGKGPVECPTCQCEMCSPPKCPEGCSIQKEFDGPCPGCDCEDNKEEKPDILEPKVICDPPKCPPGCSIESDPVGPCPVCDCKKEEDDVKNPSGVICDPPKCPPGCSIEKEFDGPCPGCDCSEDVKDFIDPRRKLNSCSPPKCPPACTIQKEFEGPCPGCDCPKEDIEDEKICPLEAVVCDGPNCKLEKDEKGCDSCKCTPECTPPKCRRWCTIKTVEDGCPVCDCSRRTWKTKNGS